ncbi:MAG: cyclase family protein [Chloroflexi bacterium]|nr:cyclase family protein [Chloroflexota bacterium]
MRYIDLTMPLYEFMPACYAHKSFEKHPLWPRAFKMENVRIEGSTYWWHVFTMFCEPGTRFILPGFKYAEDKRKLGVVDINKLMYRDTVVVDVPKEAGEFVRPEDLEKAIKKAPAKKGDALLIRTGWGDDRRWAKLETDYKYKSPHFTDTAVKKLLELMQTKGMDMWLYDTCEMVGGVDPVSGRPGSFDIRPGLCAVGGLINCGEIKKPRVKLMVLPLKIRDAWMGPCRVVAIED